MKIITHKRINSKGIFLGKSQSARSLKSKQLQDELKLLLLKKGLSIGVILDKYKEILESEYKKPLTSDIVKVLENISKLHGLSSEEPKSDLLLMLASKSESEITQYLEDITSKTQKYLLELKSKSSK